MKSTLAAGAALLSTAFSPAGAVPAATAPHMPPMAVSNEADQKQLALARRQGAAYVALVEWERQGSAWSATTDAGDYRIVAAITPAEGAWLADGGTPAWHEAPAAMVHLRVFAEDRGSGRFVPALTMRARFLDQSGAMLGEALLPFALYPATDAYGANVVLPAGAASLAVIVEPMRLMRHDPYNGDRFSTQTTAIMPLTLAAPPVGPAASERAEQVPPALIAERRAALEDTFKVMWSQASSGGEKTVDGVIIDYAVEYSEAFWMFDEHDKFRYSIENDGSNKTNAHIEVAPRDPRTGRFLPAAKVTATITGAKGTTGTNDVPLLWHSWLYHFGRNWRVPSAGTYRLDLAVVPDSIAHYGRTTGNTFFAPVNVSFDDVKIRVGGK